MKRHNKILLIIAGALVTAGIILGTATAYFIDFDFKKLNTVSLSYKTFETEAEFENIEIKSAAFDVTILPSNDGKCKIIYPVGEKIDADITVKDKSLSFAVKDKRSVKEMINISFGEADEDIKLYLPEKSYKNIKLSSVSSDTEMTNIICESLSVTSVSGDTEMTNIICESLSVTSVSGDTELIGVTADKSISIESTSGDIKFEKTDSKKIDINSVSGDVKGTFDSDKDYSVSSVSGNVKVPKSVKGGEKCSVTTTSGDIKIK